MAERSEIERFQRAQDLLRRLRSLSPQEREAVLDAECEGDADLREEVVSLLAVEDEGPDSVLDATSPGHRVRGFLTEPPPPEINAPVQVGPHRIVRLIGEGGMGAVYEAEQAEPRRRIAVKVLRNGLASPEARRRFQREAEVLGRLRHPGIAMLHEAGIDDTHSRYGAPWFSMELVEGRPITLHVQDQEDITKEGKLELLTQLCSAVAHAHHEGVVHRDLKPDNILVDRQGQVRVLDFGIARTADAIGEGQTSLTRTGDVIGTLAYMSPEQALGRPDLIDGRSDVYSIGVIAFELLTGRLPHDLDELGLPAALHEITESEADRLGSLDGSLRGDLEAIIGKALEKDRDRRYASVDEFLDDLERYLRHQPVVARPPTLRYRLARFIRRNRAVSAALALTLLTLVTAVIVTTNKALEANASAAEARYSQYVAQLQAASAALGDEDPESARAHLDRAPEPLREFEWHHLHSRLDASLLHVVLPFPIQWDSALPAVFRRAETGSLSVLRILGKTSLLDVDLQTGEQRVSWRARPGETLLTLSPDGEHCLLRSANQVLLVHLESDSRRELAPFPGEHSESFIFSPAGRWVVIKSREPPGLLVHAVPGGDRILELEMPDFSHLLLFATDTSLLIHSKTEPTRLVELPSGRTVHWFEDSDDWIRFCASSSANRVVAGVGDDSTTARDLSTGKAAPWVNSRSAKASPARFLDFDPTGRWLAIAQDDRMQRLLDGQSGRQLRELGRAAHATPWLRAFSSDGDWLAVSTDSGVLKAVPTTSDRPPSLLPGHERAARFLRFLPDSPLLVSVTDIDLRTWNVEQPTLTMLQGHDSYVYDLSVSPDGRSVASAAWDGTVRTWDLTTTRAAHVLQFDGQREPYGLVAHSPDGGLLATTHSFEARLWNSATGELLHRLPFSPPIDPDTGRIVDSWYLHQPIAIAWHPSGTWFAVGSGGRPLQAWSVGGPRDDLRVEPLSWPVHGNALAFSPDGRWLAASVGHYDAPATVELWSLSERRRVSTLTGPRSRVAELDFSPDSRQLAAAVEDGTVRTWSVPEGEPGLVLRAHPERAYSVAWSPDGRRLATGANDDDLRLWDPATGRELLRLQGHSDYIHALAWDPSGNFLISGSGDGDLRIWGTRALRERHAASSGPR